MPLISVIIPVYNVEPYLKKCVDSILEQDFLNFELILIDDGSTDKSGIICDKIGNVDPRVVVFHKENGGQSEARNMGLDNARGEYICFVDSDDYVEKTYLSYLLSLFSYSEDCKIVQANHYVVRGKNQTTNSKNLTELKVFSRRDAFEAVLFHDRVDVSPWGKLFHRSLFDDCRFPVNKIYEDTFIFGELLKETKSYVYGGCPKYYYIMHENSTVNGLFSSKRLYYIDSVKHLADIALAIDPNLNPACERRLTHARLSVLRYMEHCPAEYKKIRDELRIAALQYAREVCANPRTPQRDKVALILLKLGYFPFYKGWNLYNRFR